MALTVEEQRLEASRTNAADWRLWGPYLSERQWGTVREDYSADGSAWDYFPHDQARSRAYRWGEDGIAGISDSSSRLCFSIALWNGADPILKERLFGLTNSEGNHGEDIKEYAFYLDNTPTHSYMKMVYKYPHSAFPYADLLAENNRRKADPASFEYELLDTGAFAQNRYSDLQVEYAKADVADILIRITVTNRGDQPQRLHLLPTLWFRNTWSWKPGTPKPALTIGNSADPAVEVIQADHPELGTMLLYCDKSEELLFVENETNFERFGWGKNASGFPKDGINDYIVSNRPTVNPAHQGTKSSVHYDLMLQAGETRIVKLRLTHSAPLTPALGADYDSVFAARIQEADDFYARIQADGMSDDLKSVQRQAFAGMLWCKQFYSYVVEEWLNGDPVGPPPPESRKEGRNSRWLHFYAEDVLSMPDKWEYPWFASWDACFHTVVWAMIDPEFAKGQLLLLAREWYMHPEGQVPAYEWSFDDTNPPVHAWAAWRIYNIEQKMYGTADLDFLTEIFERCLLFFTWWLNRKDKEGNNLFQGGFLGLDNIGVFDRDEVPDGTTIYQVDASSWMGLFTLTMGKIGWELESSNSKFDGMGAKFLQHFVYIADALNHVATLPDGMAELWNEDDGFFYDVLRKPDGTFQELKVRSVEGLLPIVAVELITEDWSESMDDRFWARLQWFLGNHPEILNQLTSKSIVPPAPGTPINDVLERSQKGDFLFTLVEKDKLTRILKYLLDESEFLSPHGIRSVSQYHRDHPVTVDIVGTDYTLQYAPAESNTRSFGGNSNWRGPVWFPINFLLIEALQKYDYFYGEDFKVECPTGSGNLMTLWEVSQEISRRLISIFARDANGSRPVYGGTQYFQTDPHWRDYLLFFEYFHGDNGAGLGASHQTGWTGLVAKLIQQTTEYANKPPG
jgi:hypothetical protein